MLTRFNLGRVTNYSRTDDTPYLQGDYMKYIGAHVSTVGGVENAPLNAHAIGAKAFACFTKNQQQWHSLPLRDPIIAAFKENCKKFAYQPQHILPHSSYLINLGSPKADVLAKSRAALVDELQRCEQLGLQFLNVHPGSHLGLMSVQECLKTIAASINFALQKVSSVSVVLENTAGQGGNVGFRFEHLAEIIKLVEDKRRVGVCIDTCHAFAAGYDITTKEKCAEVFAAFDEIIGFKYLKGMHLNDSKSALGSRVDRHENLGKGTIGVEVFKFIMQDAHFDNIPLILETIDSALWADEIKMLYKMAR